VVSSKEDSNYDLNTFEENMEVGELQKLRNCYFLTLATASLPHIAILTQPVVRLL
jgi:hypothetical protein